MRMLVLTPEFPPLVKGGVGKQVGELATALVEQGHSVTVMALAPQGNVPGAPSGGNPEVHWVPVPSPSPPGYAADVLHQNLAMLSACIQLGRHDYDLVVLQHYTPGLAAVEVARAWGIPLVWHAHAMYSATLEDTGLQSETHQELQYFRAFERTIGRQACRVVAISSYIAQLCTDLLDIPPSRIAVIPKSLHLEDFRPYSAHKKRNQPPIVAFVGRISWEKGLEMLLEAISQLSAQEFPVHLLVAGIAEDHAYLDSIKALIQRLGISQQVMMRGFVGGVDLIKLYHQAAVVAIPSRYEAFGRVAIEAMAAGTPVVATAVGGLREVIADEVNGMLVANAEEMASALKVILTDRDLAARLSANGLTTVADTYSWPRVLRQTLDCYEECIGAGN